MRSSNFAPFLGADVADWHFPDPRRCPTCVRKEHVDQAAVTIRDFMSTRPFKVEAR
jgi:hypothetical protein